MKHNKKRNVGLVYEFLTRRIGEAVLAGNDSEITNIKSLLKKHYNKSTSLYKELKLFRALSESKLSSRESAYSLLTKVKDACAMESQSRLDLEKTSLIKDINVVLGESLFDMQVAEYKEFANIQQLLNRYRQDKNQIFESINEITLLEEKVVTNLLIESLGGKRPLVENVSEMTNTDVDRLVVNLMTEKVNAKFSDELNSDQKSMITMYVFQNEQSLQNLSALFTRLKESFMTTISGFENDSVITEKVSEVKKLLETKFNDTQNISEEMVTFYLGLSKLKEEIENVAA